MTKKSFNKITKKNYNTVKKWSKWKQKIIISAKTAESGKFIGGEI